MPISQPAFIPLIWASDANADKNTIPTTMATPTDNAAASWTMGFPTETSDPIAAGGVYVSRKDFNGAFHAITAHLFFGQSGSLYEWSNTLDYNVGAAILGSDGKEYRCITANGVSSTVVNPVNDVNYAYWKPLTLFLVDVIYPVGSIYMTFNSTDPNTAFGGTWVKIQGKFLYGSDSTHSATETGGASTYTLTTTNLPSHNHSVSITSSSNGAHTHSLSGSTSSAGSHTHTRGTMDITGNVDFLGTKSHRTITRVTGAFTGGGEAYVGSEGSFAHDSQNQTSYLSFSASRSWTGSTSSEGAHTHTISGTAASAGAHTHSVSGNTGNTGGGTAFSVMPPYYVVNIWRRTA